MYYAKRYPDKKHCRDILKYCVILLFKYIDYNLEREDR